MTEDDTPPDVDGLAKRYVDFWEQHMATLNADPEVAKTIAQTMNLMSAGAAQMTTIMQGIAAAQHKPDNTGDVDRKSEAPIAASDQSAPDSPEHDVRELSRRIAELERRLTALEAKK